MCCTTMLVFPLFFFKFDTALTLVRKKLTKVPKILASTDEVFFTFF